MRLLTTWLNFLNKQKIQHIVSLFFFYPVTSGLEETRVPAVEIFSIRKIKAVFNLIIVTRCSQYIYNRKPKMSALREISL